MTANHQPKKHSTLQACGFTIVSSFAAVGCVPSWAEDLTPDEKPEFRETLDEINEHMDLTGDIMNRLDKKLLFVDDGSVTSPTADDVLAQQEEALENGYEMLEDDRIYVYRGVRFPETSAHNDAAAFTVSVGKPFVVFLESYLTDKKVIVHELTHTVTDQGHTDAMHEAAAASDILTVPMVISDQDNSFRDTLVFQTQEIIDDELHSQYEIETDNYDDPDRAFTETYDVFKSKYSNFSMHIDLIQNHTDEWATKFVNQSFYGHNYGASNEWIISGGKDNTKTTGMWSEMGMTQEKIVEIYTLPSTQYLRDDAIQMVEHAEKKLQDANPEYYAQYQNEPVLENRIQSPEVHRGSMRLRPL